MTKPEEVPPSGEQGKWSTWGYIETQYGAKVSAAEFELHAHWRGLATIEKVRDVMRLVGAAPALYEALKATSCRYSRVRECVGPEMCDRCAALALVDPPQETNDDH